MSKQDKILELLANLEDRYNITILYAVESGSRAWGFNSPESDYDIRFIYIHNDLNYYDIWDYLSKKQKLDTIEGFTDDTLTDDRLLDWGGWDIKKAIQLLKESNPGILEWLHSPIIYLDKNGLAQHMRDVYLQMHTNTSLCYHYRSMAERNWHDRIEGKTNVVTKKYMYIIRPTCMLHWLMTFPDKPLVINFYQILHELQTHMEPEVVNALNELIDLKKTTKNMGNKRIPIIDTYIQDVLAEFNKMSGKKTKEINVQCVVKQFKKIETHYKKIRSITAKCDKLNRSEYLVMFGFCLQFIWLKQHPDCNQRDVPSRLSDLLKEVDIPEAIHKQISDITLGMEKILELTDPDTLSPLREVKLTTEEDKLIPNHKFRKMLKSILHMYYRDIYVADDSTKVDMKITDLPLHPNVIKFMDEPEVTPLPRGDLIEFWMKKQIPELLWLLENNEYKISRIPGQVYSKIQSYPEDFGKLVNQAIDEGKTDYYMYCPEIHQWIEELITTNKDYVAEVTERNSKLREAQIKSRYENSIKDIDPMNFGDIFLRQKTNVLAITTK